MQWNLIDHYGKPRNECAVIVKQKNGLSSFCWFDGMDFFCFGNRETKLSIKEIEGWQSLRAIDAELTTNTQEYW
jgi:hypothetical protein